jgi:DNA polymerase-3 subunit gamma/tau
MFDRMLRCCDELGKTLQPRLVLDCALIDVATIEPLVPLGDLIERLGELEGRIARGAPARSGGGGEPLRSAPAGVRPSRGPTPQSAASQGAAPQSAMAQSATPERPSSSAPSQSAPPMHAMASSAPSPSTPSRTPAPTPTPIAMQPSSPVPAPASDAIATGSGPHAPVLATPSNPAEALAAWRKVIDYLEEQRKISLRGYYEFARVVSWTKDEIDLGFAPDPESKWAGENAIEKQNVDDLRAVLAELGQKLKVTVRLLDAAEAAKSSARSLIESTRAVSSAERSRREAEAREHPITKHVLQTFGAHIKEIKTDV